MAGFWFVLEYVIMCTFVTLLHSSYHEMLDFNPMDMKFYMMILDTLMDVLGLVWYFSHLPFLFYACVNMVWQFVSHIWLFNLYHLISMPNDLGCFWFFVCWSCWMCWMFMNFSRIIWIISVLIWNFHSWCPYMSLEIAFDFFWSWNAFDDWFWCEPF
jgi:hypothetical protein